MSPFDKMSVLIQKETQNFLDDFLDKNGKAAIEAGLGINDLAYNLGSALRSSIENLGMEITPDIENLLIEAIADGFVDKGELLASEEENPPNLIVERPRNKMN